MAIYWPPNLAPHEKQKVYIITYSLSNRLLMSSTEPNVVILGVYDSQTKASNSFRLFREAGLSNEMQVLIEDVL